MTENVVGLWNQHVGNLKQVDEDVVKILEDLLERARSGEINGVAIAVHNDDETSTEKLAGTMAFSLIGRLFSLQERCLREMRK